MLILKWVKNILKTKKWLKKLTTTIEVNSGCFLAISPDQKILFRTIFTLVCVKYNVARGGNHINIIITTDSRGDNHNKLGQNKNRICHTVHYSLLTIIKGTAELYNSRGFLQARVNNHHRYNKSGLILSKVLTKKLTFGNLPKQLLPWLV